MSDGPKANNYHQTELTGEVHQSTKAKEQQLARSQQKPGVNTRAKEETKAQKPELEVPHTHMAKEQEDQHQEQ